jgi:hypothetical protein
MHGNALRLDMAWKHLRLMTVRNSLAMGAWLSLFCMAFGVVRGQNVIHVSPIGSDLTGLGTPLAPFQTLNFAIGVAASGDTLYLQPGVFLEVGIVLPHQKSLVFWGM